MQKEKRNAVFKAVEAAGLSPQDFDWDDGDSETNIRHRPTGSSFYCGGSAGSYDSRYEVGDHPPEERTGLSQSRLDEQVKFWLYELKKDVETPDLWAQVQRPELFAALSAEDNENTPFTAAERVEIAGQLRELRDRISQTQSLTELQTSLLDERLEYLASASSRVGRKDWLLMFGGVILGYVVESALPPEVARDIVGTLLSSIGHLLGNMPRGLPPGA